MAKQLGPTFGDEVIAAGLGGLPFAWGATDETITGRENLTPAQNATLDAVIAAHDPTKKLKNVIPTSDFVARFTNAEYVLLLKQRAADTAQSKVGSSKNWDIVVTEDNVDLNKQKSQTLKEQLVEAGVISAARSNEIFS